MTLVVSQNSGEESLSLFSLPNTPLSELFPVRVKTGCAGVRGLTLDLTFCSPVVQSSPVNRDTGEKRSAINYVFCENRRGITLKY